MATVAEVRRGNPALWLTVLLALFVIINYMDRGAIAVAAPRLKTELGLNHEQFGLAVSAFAWIYAPAQFFIGWLSARICVYRLLAGGLLLWALATFSTGFVGGLTALVALRVILGIGEGVAFPCASKVIAEHVPERHRGIANGMIGFALGMGPALGILAGGLILNSYGWRPIFWTFGALTLLWLLPWQLASKPHWKTRELAKAEAPVSFWKIARKRGAWTMGVAHLTNTWPFYFLLAWLPLYLIENRGFTILQMTKLTTMVYLLQGGLAPLWGWLSDGFVRAGRNEAAVRRSMIILYQLTSGLGVLGAALAKSPEMLAASLLFAGAFGGIGGQMSYTISQMFAGKSSGAWVGVVNGIGNITGIIMPLITGWVIQSAGGNFLAAFILSAGVSFAGALWWIVAVPPIRPDPELHPA